MKKLYTGVFFICTLISVAQSRQVVRGRVADAVTQLPVTGAQVVLAGIEVQQTLTDSAGDYSAEVLPGRYRLLVQHPDFKSLVRENVVVMTGKQQVQDLELHEFTGDLGIVTVKSSRAGSEIDLGPANVQQYAAVFYDPARVAYSHAGVINADDGTNQTTVRGTSPNFLQWKLEGVEIVNPNHLENAGTLNDRPAANGGGVTLISAQLLESSSFLFPPFDAIHGNALSGIYDMRLRKGNDEKREHTIQVSLLGTDLSIEGPFSSKSPASYLFNFRYSTIGLLSKMGVNFGDERTSFLDFSHLLSFPHRRGYVRVFGMSGSSETLYSGARDSSQLEIQKELQDIEYRSFTSINGISLLNRLGEKAFLKTVVVYSFKDVNRSAVPSPADHLLAPRESDLLSQRKFSTLNYVSGRINNAFSFRTGLYINYFEFSAKSKLGSSELVNGRTGEPLLQPFADVEGRLSKYIDVRGGVHVLHLPMENYLSVQPRASLRFLLTKYQDVQLRYGLSDQVQPQMLRMAHPLNSGLVPSKCHAFSLLYTYAGGSWRFKGEVYEQLFQDLPENDSARFNALNYFNEQPRFLLSQSGKGEVQGLDLSVQTNHKGYYAIFSSSIYGSWYRGSQNVTRPSRFSTDYNIFITAGKEHKLKKNNNVISLDLRLMSRNGFLESDPNSAGSYFYNKRLPSYQRMDLRFSFRKNRVKSSSIWALDIQNLTNRQNVGYHYADRFTGKVETKYQLGLIPVLSYKVMF